MLRVRACCQRSEREREVRVLAHTLFTGQREREREREVWVLAIEIVLYYDLYGACTHPLHRSEREKERGKEG